MCIADHSLKMTNEIFMFSQNYTCIGTTTNPDYCILNSNCRYWNTIEHVLSVFPPNPVVFIRLDCCSLLLFNAHMQHETYAYTHRRISAILYIVQREQNIPILAQVFLFWRYLMSELIGHTSIFHKALKYKPGIITKHYLWTQRNTPEVISSSLNFDKRHTTVYLHK